MGHGSVPLNVKAHRPYSLDGSWKPPSLGLSKEETPVPRGGWHRARGGREMDTTPTLHPLSILQSLSLLCAFPVGGWSLSMSHCRCLALRPKEVVSSISALTSCGNSAPLVFTGSQSDANLHSGPCFNKPVTLGELLRFSWPQIAHLQLEFQSLFHRVCEELGAAIVQGTGHSAWLIMNAHKWESSSRWSWRDVGLLLLATEGSKSCSSAGIPGSDAGHAGLAPLALRQKTTGLSFLSCPVTP
jgi:hypothetical protein